MKRRVLLQGVYNFSFLSAFVFLEERNKEKVKPPTTEQILYAPFSNFKRGKVEIKVPPQ
jgi:hypothetical protein